jgi:hypothetical protein
MVSMIPMGEEEFGIFTIKMHGEQKRSAFPGGGKLIGAFIFLLLLFEQSPDFIMDFLLVHDTRKKDTDTVGIVLDVRGLVIEDKEDLIVSPEAVLLAFPPHVPFALLFCRRCILAVVPEYSHDQNYRVLILCPGYVKDIHRGANVRGPMLQWKAQ